MIYFKLRLHLPNENAYHPVDLDIPALGACVETSLWSGAADVLADFALEDVGDLTGERNIHILKPTKRFLGSQWVAQASTILLSIEPRSPITKWFSFSDQHPLHIEI